MSNADIIYKSIEYIENNLTNKISVDDIASHIGFSKFHFSRVFAKLTGYSPYDYFRGRKVTETLEYMIREKVKIIDAAYAYGFSSPESFARACVKVFNQAPSSIRKKLASNEFEGLKPVTKEFLYFTEKYNDMQVKFIEMPELWLTGIGYISDQKDDWQMIPDQLTTFVKTIIEREQSVYKVNLNDTLNNNNHLRFIGFRSEEDTDLFSELMTKKIPATTYLMIGLENDEKEMSLMYEYLNNYYLPKHDYVRTLPAEIEAMRFEQTGTSLRESTIFIPVSKKDRNK